MTYSSRKINTSRDFNAKINTILIPNIHTRTFATLDCVRPQVAQAHEWLLVCLVFAHDFENKFYF